MMRRFSLEQFLENTERFNCTDLTLVPPIALAIIMSPLSKKRPYLKKTKSAISGAAPLSKDVQAKLRSLLGEEAPFTQLWGMTETCCVAIMFKYPEHDDTGSVGRLLPNIEAKHVSYLSHFFCLRIQPNSP
jgi:long-subunit acyl-CoA synthetase (AMP-forming)